MGTNVEGPVGDWRITGGPAIPVRYMIAVGEIRELRGPTRSSRISALRYGVQVAAAGPAKELVWAKE